jgi:spoIIIJ-associated protein
MNSLEITAKSVDEAKKAAAEKLGVSLDQLTVTVLEETKGLFGKSSVRIKAEVNSAPAPAPAAAAPSQPAKGGRAPRAPKEAPKEAPVAAPVVEAAPIVEEAPAKRDNRRGKKPVDAPAAEPAAEGETEETGGEEIVATPQQAEQLAALLRELMENAGLQVNVKTREVSGRYVTLGLDGKDAAYMVGKHGEVLNALQYLVNIIAGRRYANGVRATLDANDYRRRREETLTALAVRIAEQVKERGEEAVLDALPAFERRVVHKALGEISGISTYSEGEEPNRRVVIAPAD